MEWKKICYTDSHALFDARGSLCCNEPGWGVRKYGIWHPDSETVPVQVLVCVPPPDAPSAHSEADQLRLSGVFEFVDFQDWAVYRVTAQMNYNSLAQMNYNSLPGVHRSFPPDDLRVPSCSVLRADAFSPLGIAMAKLQRRGRFRLRRLRALHRTLQAPGSLFIKLEAATIRAISSYT